MKIKILFLTSILLMSFSVYSYAEMQPRKTAADQHIKVVTYDPNNVVVLHGRYGYQTQITFSANETIQSVSIGDSLAWQAVPVNNHLFVKPVTESTTNMTVLTNSNSYNFQLDSSTQSAPTYKLQFNYPAGGYDNNGTSNTVGTFDPSKINWKYSFTGSRNLAPIEAYDNNQFTYFKFKHNGASHMPAIFTVDKDKNETLVNYHMQGDYLVVNSVTKQFTLRNGNEVTSVYNDWLIGDWQNIS